MLVLHEIFAVLSSSRLIRFNTSLTPVSNTRRMTDTSTINKCLRVALQSPTREFPYEIPGVSVDETTVVAASVARISSGDILFQDSRGNCATVNLDNPQDSQEYSGTVNGHTFSLNLRYDLTLSPPDFPHLTSV